MKYFNVAIIIFISILFQQKLFAQDITKVEAYSLEELVESKKIHYGESIYIYGRVVDIKTEIISPLDETKWITGYKLIDRGYSTNIYTNKNSSMESIKNGEEVAILCEVQDVWFDQKIVQVIVKQPLQEGGNLLKKNFALRKWDGIVPQLPKRITVDELYRNMYQYSGAEVEISGQVFGIEYLNNVGIGFSLNSGPYYLFCTYYALLWQNSKEQKDFIKQLAPGMQVSMKGNLKNYDKRSGYFDVKNIISIK